MLTSQKFQKIAGTDLFLYEMERMQQIGGRCLFLGSTEISTRDTEFKETLKKTDYLVLDGVYFAFASLLLQRKNIKRNQAP